MKDKFYHRRLVMSAWGSTTATKRTGAMESLCCVTLAEFSGLPMLLMSDDPQEPEPHSTF